MVRRLFVSAVTLRCALYLFWMHSVVLPEYLLPGQQTARVLNLPTPLQFRRSVLDHNRNNSNRNNNYNNNGPEPLSPSTRARERRQRTRPPVQQRHSTNTTTSSSTSTTLSASDWHLDLARVFQSQTTHTVTAAQQDDPDDAATIDWTALCDAAGLNQTSRVVVTGLAATQASTATALTLALVQQCRVERVTGVDALFPNVRRHRMQFMQNTYRLLLRSVPAWNFVVPVAGLDARPNYDHEWLTRSEPTHIVHFESRTSTGTGAGTGAGSADIPNLMTDANYRLYQQQESVTVVRQFLQAMTTMNRRNTNSKCRLVHVVRSGAAADSAIDTNQIPTVLAATYHKLFGTAWTQLHLPAVYGPLTLTGTTRTAAAAAATASPQEGPNKNTKNTPALYVDHAVAAILKALQYKPGVHSMHVHVVPPPVAPVPNKNLNHYSEAQTLAWRTEQEHPYGLGGGVGAGYITNASFPATSAKYVDTYLANPRRFPCSSSCVSPTIACLPSAPWGDNVLAASQMATHGCQFVAYMANFSATLDILHPPKSTADELCRVAFVSGQSPLVKEAILNSTPRNLTQVPTETLLQKNGFLQSNGWTLVWVPFHNDDTLSDADNALPLIDPGRLFAPSVFKAVFLGSSGFARTSDNMLLRVLLHMDRVKLDSHSVKERRSGTKVSRWVSRPPERARRAILFVGEPPAEEIPTNASDFVEMLGAQGMVSAKQLTFYQQAAHLVQINDQRPEHEIRQTVYNSFPYQWTRLSILIHDFTMEESRQLRCDWYDEHLFWGDSRNLEELSLAYVIAKRRIESDLGENLGDDADTDSSWIPLLKDSGDEYKAKERVVNQKGAEVFIRVMPR